MGFLRNNLPLPGTSGEEMTFWDRFQFRRGAKLYTAESHSQCVQQDWLNASCVWNYDAHHDLGYRPEDIDGVITGHNTCQNWLLSYALLGAQIKVQYPRWKIKALEVETTPACPQHLFDRGWVTRRIDDGIPPPIVFDAVFICRSGAWVPPWLDSNYQKFLDSCPLKQVELQPLVKRQWSKEHQQELVDHDRMVQACLEVTK